ncbi:MAG: hypothetical protein MK193_00695 [Lentisphaeria bacterium]|nr:hypothetical protein [Lentisphaeria bacterium]
MPFLDFCPECSAKITVVDGLRSVVCPQCMAHLKVTTSDKPEPLNENYESKSQSVASFNKKSTVSMNKNNERKTLTNIDASINLEDIRSDSVYQTKQPLQVSEPDIIKIAKPMETTGIQDFFLGSPLETKSPKPVPEAKPITPIPPSPVTLKPKEMDTESPTEVNLDHNELMQEIQAHEAVQNLSKEVEELLNMDFDFDSNISPINDIEQQKEQERLLRRRREKEIQELEEKLKDNLNKHLDDINLPPTKMEVDSNQSIDSPSQSVHSPIDKEIKSQSIKLTPKVSSNAPIEMDTQSRPAGGPVLKLKRDHSETIPADQLAPQEKPVNQPTLTLKKKAPQTEHLPTQGNDVPPPPPPPVRQNKQSKTNKLNVGNRKVKKKISIKKKKRPSE